MNRELRDELEVPGHVVMYNVDSSIARMRATARIREILDRFEADGITKLKDLPQSIKEILIIQFDILGLPHDDLEGTNE